MSLVVAGWTHDHCEICTWELHASDDPEHGIGYSHDVDWICSECYELFIANQKR